MRFLIAAASLALSTGIASADFYVLQNVESGKCSIEQELPSSDATMVLLNNKFVDRSDAEAALKDVPACN